MYPVVCTGLQPQQPQNSPPPTTSHRWPSSTQLSYPSGLGIIAAAAAAAAKDEEKLKEKKKEDRLGLDVAYALSSRMYRAFLSIHILFAPACLHVQQAYLAKQLR